MSRATLRETILLLGETPFEERTQLQTNISLQRDFRLSTLRPSVFDKGVFQQKFQQNIFLPSVF